MVADNPLKSDLRKAIAHGLYRYEQFDVDMPDTLFGDSDAVSRSLQTMYGKQRDPASELKSLAFSGANRSAQVRLNSAQVTNCFFFCSFRYSQ